jgi:predicted RNA polymerase sigma factor
LRAAALRCVRGVPAAQAVIGECIGFYKIADELQAVQSQNADVLARLGQSIHATSRLRDAILARLYSRRDLIADGRIASGRDRC